MTVKENLRLAKETATDEEIELALKKANIYDYIISLPEGLNSKLGENGIKLSGGQRQRIAIARAILRDSKVLIFDEATSALDNKNQADIKQTISDLAKNHTIVTIAHRLTTVVDSDKIIFIKDGVVHAQGKHSELMESCKEYYDLYVEEDISNKNKV
jgi:ATP-binding cassette subfamily B protein